MTKESNITRVVGAILLNAKKSRILLTQRAFNDRFGPGLWECPGGKIDKSETDEQALRRELYEEIDLVFGIEPIFFTNVSFTANESAVLFGGHRQLDIAFYFVHTPDDWVPTLQEVAGAGWFEIEIALALPLTPGTRLVLHALAELHEKALRRRV